MSLTYIEAQERSRNLEVKSYDLHLDVTGGDEHFQVETTIRFHTKAPEVFLDYLGASVEKFQVDGKDHPFEFADERITFTVEPGEQEVYIKSTSTYSRSGQGLHRMVDNADGNVYLYSHLEPSDARRIYPCFDQPDLKAQFTTRISAPQGWVTLDNGTPTPPLSTYLTAFAAGPYVHISKQWRDIELRAFARKSMEAHLDPEILELTAQGMDFFDEAFGYPYPWGKYDSIFVPEYNLGAMENPGLVTFTEDYLFRTRPTRTQKAGRANTILHEMAHMWFGDLVTPKWWDDLWLKESFAEFMGADASVHATEYTEAWENFASTRKNWAYAQDQLPTTHPIKAEIPDVDAARQNFDGITYAKGASVLKQLVHFIGRENFYAGARDYFKKHAFGAATFEDLLAALKNHTDRDLDAWSQAWLKTAGVDTLAPDLSGATRPHRLNVALFDEDLNNYQTLDVDLPGDVEIPGKPALIVPNDGDHAYVKVQFTDASLATISERLSELAPLTRAVIWTNLWQATRDGELPVAQYVDIVIRHAGDLASAWANAVYAVKHYAQVPDFAGRVMELYRHADPASDTALVLARTAAQVAEPAELRELLETAEEPALRWAILRALARKDAVKQAELDAELERDNTLTGKARHLGASHAFPAQAEKAWELVHSGSHSNDEVDNLLAALEDKKEGFAERFFAEVESTWEKHPIEIANRLIRGLYPEQEAPASWASVGDSALRRVLLEAEDNVARTLRVREKNNKI
ncbi:aminopeptidase N [Corynebacterium phocae]|uniref:Aminopeptidase N n=1 Tax=Corynebacterium phocae TaxID=161895 RepID=A0A1L7D685_9CORY|nr:aminopeptidase N [Corynebacterium phocae]APT93551.1 aminopeptidase N [Corynebacterium phocae]KAA8720640.1 aminopeptidase N [Corynebacterium phocae]